MPSIQLLTERTVDHPILHGFSDHALVILKDRDVKLPSPSQAHLQTVLDSINGVDDICMYQLPLKSRILNHTGIFAGSRCGLIKGTELHNETSELSAFFVYLKSNPPPDWHLFKGEMPPHEYVILLKGNLAFNNPAGLLLRDLISNTTSDTLLSEIHDLRGPTYHDWQKDDPLCRNCLTKIVGEHLHLWVSHRNSGK
jgi:hypothetical protein